MGRFARQVNGKWCDPVEAANLAALDGRFHQSYVAKLKTDGEWFQAVSDEVWDALFPAAPSPSPRDLTEADFIKLGIAIVGIAKMNAALAAMPTAQILLRQYTTVPGIKYEDAVTPGTALKALLDALVAGGYFTEQEMAAFIAAWPNM